MYLWCQIWRVASPKSSLCLRVRRGVADWRGWDHFSNNSDLYIIAYFILFCTFMFPCFGICLLFCFKIWNSTDGKIVANVVTYLPHIFRACQSQWGWTRTEQSSTLASTLASSRSSSSLLSRSSKNQRPSTWTGTWCNYLEKQHFWLSNILSNQI